MPYKSKEDQRAAWKRWYKKNGHARIRAFNTRYKARNRKFVNDYKVKHGCLRCKYNRCAEALDFHHVEDNKEINVSKLAGSAVSIQAIEREISKCIVLCANCHREHHAGACIELVEDT